MRLAFVASLSTPAQEALALLCKRYSNSALEESDVIVALGGDGFMLQSLHRYAHQHRKPIFGMKAGSVGFLMNLYEEAHLPERIAKAVPTLLRPLEMSASSESGGNAIHLAVNEVSLLRQTKQAAKIRVWVNDVVRVEELVCDGIMLATAAGSTAYNLSAHGPILPLNSEVLALTPIAAFRPRRWRGAIIRRDSKVRFEVLDHYKRPVSATADASEVREVTDVIIRENPSATFTILFDPEHNLEERILNEQFAF
jgi:NAD+ kinase